MGGPGGDSVGSAISGDFLSVDGGIIPDIDSYIYVEVYVPDYILEVFDTWGSKQPPFYCPLQTLKWTCMYMYLRTMLRTCMYYVTKKM